MADTISLAGLVVRAHHGVLAQEKRDGQDFVIDLELAVDTAFAAATDDLRRTVDYAQLAERVTELVATGSVDLVETLAERVASLVLEDLRVRAVTVTVHKPHAPIPVAFGDVSVRITRRAAPTPIVLALGSNLGDRAAHLQAGLDALAHTRGVRLDRVSPVIETDPVGDEDQPRFLNAVATGTTTLPASQVLAAAQRAERTEHRVRLRHWGPRTLDVDIIAYGDVLSADPDLTLPHPRAHERAFVLHPWSLLEPEAVLAGPDGGPIADLLAAAPDAAGVTPRSDLVLDLAPRRGRGPRA